MYNVTAKITTAVCLYVCVYPTDFVPVADSKEGATPFQLILLPNKTEEANDTKP